MPSAVVSSKSCRCFLDLKGHDAVSPSLYDRDAYQVHLRQHTNEISAIRFDVLWKASNTGGVKLKLRVELRGVGAGGLPRQMTLGQSVTPGFFRRWTSLVLGGADYKNFGSLVAWRATLWSDDRLLGEQKSFLRLPVGYQVPGIRGREGTSGLSHGGDRHWATGVGKLAQVVTDEVEHPFTPRARSRPA